VVAESGSWERDGGGGGGGGGVRGAVGATGGGGGGGGEEGEGTEGKGGVDHIHACILVVRRGVVDIAAFPAFYLFLLKNPIPFVVGRENNRFLCGLRFPFLYSTLLFIIK
jgi:hypothetical protein